MHYCVDRNVKYFDKAADMQPFTIILLKQLFSFHQRQLYDHLITNREYTKGNEADRCLSGSDTDFK